jgi:CheY-like chemotaxis protein
MRQAASPRSKFQLGSETETKAPAANHARLLLAEDDPDFRYLLASALRATAHEVVEVSNGVDLLDVLGGSLVLEDGIGNFDLVLSDVQMPGWTGLDALASLGHGPPLPPVIVITAFGDDELRRRAKRAGAVAFFSKPLDIDDLCIFVHEFLQLRAH